METCPADLRLFPTIEVANAIPLITAAFPLGWNQWRQYRDTVFVREPVPDDGAQCDSV